MPTHVKGDKSEEQKEERGQQTADNIRYGQNISESGQGGMTSGMTGSANSGGAFPFSAMRKW